ncbi:Leukotriene-B(4) omega-hydroxylase 2 [Seminavis robusta]|uniref:Leukotriene-B(4) omega-hydroxylase 2 n=1 Tax=Seminavis robusta TaxID=568900 RepID=A0A9N8ELA7_9STRA|nr:Leukotriene-B(4) omega-hydroxylase 2 [Seminavis robusta]|eukprot:Sro1153_g247030.1 Leukotriene-B(4) omega-hydroxylase 2 (491) ;mRNA; f:18846-20518
MTQTTGADTSPTVLAVSNDSLLLGLLSLFLGGSIWYFLAHNKKKRSPTLPYPIQPPNPHFLLGHAKLLDHTKGPHFDIKLLELAKQLGGVFSLQVPVLVAKTNATYGTVEQGTMIVVADPALIKHVTVTKNFPKSWTMKKNIPLFGETSILLQGDEAWKRLRKTFAPGFTTSFLKDMVAVMCDKLDRFMECIEQEDVRANQPTQMMTRAQTFTSDVIVQIAFGEDWGGTKPHDARGYITEITEGVIFADKDIKTKLFGWEHRRRMKVLEAKIDEVMQQVLDRRLGQLDTKGKINGASTTNSTTTTRNFANVCTLAIDSMRKERPDGVLTEEDRTVIVHQLKTFYFAGHDTTATTISWAIWLLSQHPNVLEKLRAELRDRQIFSTPEQRPTYEQLQQCEYLEAILKEVLRLYPPERFVGVPPEEYADKYIPFLKGPRVCLGKYFALLEAKLAISALAQRYDMSCVNPNETISYRITTSPLDGARVQLSMRK